MSFKNSCYATLKHKFRVALDFYNSSAKVFTQNEIRFTIPLSYSQTEIFIESLKFNSQWNSNTNCNKDTINCFYYFLPYSGSICFPRNLCFSFRLCDDLMKKFV